MASYGQPVPAPASRPGQAAAYGAPIQPPSAPAAPHGTFAPGTKIQVGSHRVVIQKYLSEGGFAHVYLVKLPAPVDGTDLAVLKRVAVADKDALRGMRTEVETMKRLKGHKAIVTYMDSHASELRGGGYEVFLLMEYCNGGGLIDFMNTRLQHRLTEPEILNIFSDVAEGVACMHYLKPPLLHRDLKVENVLITTTGSARKFKLCDFGSAAPPKPAPVSVVECRLMDEDIQRHTTLQYRSPEMIDVYRKQPIDEKSDIWALGVLLYKLCYYTTPFEDQGQLAILNASYRFPSYPVFTDRLKKLIAWMLKESPQARPNIYQVLREACAMQGKEVPVKDIYGGRSQSEPRGSERAGAAEKQTTPPVVGAVFVPPTKQQQVIPEVVPMRRGRPPVASQTQPQPVQAQAAKPSPSPMRVTNGDPFAALDAKYVKAGGGVDELSSRFPTLDQFALLHDQGAQFSFDESGSKGEPPRPKDLAQRVAERLADDAFASVAAPTPAAAASQRPSQPADIPTGRAYTTTAERHAVASPPPPPASAPAAAKPLEMSRASAIISSTPELQAISSQASQSYQQSTPARPKMVSTGTMTSPPLAPVDQPLSSDYHIYRFPPVDQHRSSSVPRPPTAGSSAQLRPESSSLPRGAAMPRIPSFHAHTGHGHGHGHSRQPSSSRPSLEGGRPSLDVLEPMMKSRSQTSRPRPASTHLESNLDYLREREYAARPMLSPGHHGQRLGDKTPSPRLDPNDETNIESNVDFLRSMEDSEPKKEKLHSKQSKRASLSSLSGTKHILAGKFGDAFKRFEGGASGVPPPRTPSPLKQLERQDLTPITGSEATDGRSDDESALEVTDDMTPEMRREIERRRLSMEEKRVAAAGAEYRQRIAQRGAGDSSSASAGGSGVGPAPLPKSIGGVSRAVSIQNRVQSLLSESQSSSGGAPRTAQGYGHFTDETGSVVARGPDERADIPRKPVVSSKNTGVTAAAGGRPAAGDALPVRRSATFGSETSPSASASRPIPTGGSSKPMAKPKPTHLNKALPGGNQPGGSGGTRLSSSPTKLGLGSASGSASSKPLPPNPPSTSSQQQQQFMMAADLPGQPVLDMTLQERDDYIRDFAKRFPSLTSIEMVERDLAAEAEERAR